MKVYYTEKFKKHFKQRIAQHKTLQKKFAERMTLFLVSRTNPLLRDHQLKGKKQSLRAFSITGDIRVVYFLDKGDAHFVDIGTHNQVY